VLYKERHAIGPGKCRFWETTTSASRDNVLVVEKGLIRTSREEWY